MAPVPPPADDTDLRFAPLAELDEGERAALRALSAAVYPPDQAGDWPGRHVEWAAPTHAARIFDGGRQLSHVGALLRDGLVDGEPCLIGGIGGVMTHPDHRGRGLAAEGIHRALSWMADAGADLALLVCDPKLMPYYHRLGWRPFDGSLVVVQRGAREIFTFNRAMTHGLGGAAVHRGEIDLCGKPW